MVDRDRFKKQAQTLRETAKQIAVLSQLPERLTTRDLQDLADMANNAADTIDEMLRAALPGCTCRRIQENGYDYLDYAEGCRHHEQYRSMREQLKASYAKSERALKDAARLPLVATALSGSALTNRDPDDLVKNAIAIADEAVERIAREANNDK